MPAPSLDKLNAAQREVVLLRSHCVAVACPGAGKTSTMATKAAHLLSDPEVVVGAVTFSKDAALELRERILALAGETAKRRLIAGTFHSLAYKQIRVKGSKGQTILMDGERLALVDQALQAAELDWKLDDAIKVIENLKTDLAIVPTDTPEGRLLAAYQESLQRNGALDFHDMLRLSVSGMQSGSLKPYPFHHLLVDEFQDTDPLQYQWVCEHALHGVTITLVGDDDQSIYGFRSALGFRGMESFIRQFDAQPVILGSNYRCRAEILAAADRVIVNNRDRIPKTLAAERGPGGTIGFSRFGDEYDEAVAAVEALSPFLSDGRSGAILARTNRILDPVEAVCRSHGLKYYRASGTSILNRPEAALVGSLLELVQRVRSGGMDTLLGFAGLSVHELRSLHEKLGPGLQFRQVKELAGLALSDSSVDTFRDFSKRLSEWRALCERQFFSLVLEGVSDWMLRHAKTDAAKRAIRTTYDVLSRLNGPFSDRLEFLRRKNNEPGNDAIVLTTLHSAKGLEWDAVVLIRVEETVLPDEKGTSEAEERRLFYVGMTRARDSLFISTAKKNPTSRFVFEAGLLQT